MELNVSAPTARRAWLDVPKDDIAAWLAERGQPAMRARQIWRWLFAGRAETFAAMTDLPAALRRELEETYLLFGSSTVKRSEAGDRTGKLVVRLADGNLV